MICPICDQSSSRLFQAHGYWIRSCDTCSHRFAELEPGTGHLDAVYGDAYFFGGGAGYADYLASSDELRERGRFYGRLLRNRVAPGRLLDVGAAAGYVLAGLRDEGWTGVGLEPNGTMVSHARSELGLEMHRGALEDVELKSSFDVVVMVQVLPHLRDLRAGVATVARLVRPGGLCLIETWNRESVAARLFGQHWHEYSPPSVLHWFSPQGVVRLFERHGFTLLDRGRPPRRILAEHARSLLRYKSEGRWWGRAVESVGRLIPDRASLPYPADDLMWVLLARSP
ncbi:MAG: hypothetical protein AMXMBFR64_52880 [Myxococcales bacterium]